MLKMTSSVNVPYVECDEYSRKADEFCNETSTKITITFKGIVVNPWHETNYMSNWCHNQYRVRIDRNHQTYSFDFTDSKSNTDKGVRPNKYDVLSCVEKYVPDSFHDFCSEYGYDEYADYYENATVHGYDKKSYKIYRAVKREAENIHRLFADVIDKLCEIQ